MSVVTLHSKRVVNVTPANVDDAVREDIAAYEKDGVHDTGLFASIQAALYAAAGKQYVVTEEDRQATRAMAQSVIDNPFVQASDWTTSTVNAAIDEAGKGGQNLSTLARLLQFMQSLSTTVKVVAISGAVVVVGGATVYLVFKFKR